MPEGLLGGKSSTAYAQTLVGKDSVTPGRGELTLLCVSPHSQAISAFVSLIITGRFLVAAILLLLVEVSNIFLTIRMLLKMSNVPSPVLYEANKYINLVMYFAFRLAPQAYLTWYFLRYVEVQGQGAFLTANLLLLDAMILMYFSRLLRSDFFPSLRKGSARRDVDGEKFLID